MEVSVFFSNLVLFWIRTSLIDVAISLQIESRIR